MRESVIEKYFKKRVTGVGGEVRKVRWIGRRGAPDRRAMLLGLCCWIEFKAPGEKLKPHQAREHRRMRERGEDVRVIDTIEAVDIFMDMYLYGFSTKAGAVNYV